MLPNFPRLLSLLYIENFSMRTKKENIIWKVHFSLTNKYSFFLSFIFTNKFNK